MQPAVHWTASAECSTVADRTGPFFEDRRNTGPSRELVESEPSPYELHWRRNECVAGRVGSASPWRNGSRRLRTMSAVGPIGAARQRESARAGSAQEPVEHRVAKFAGSRL